eukprot:tig00020510_g9841.t1
MRSRPTFRPPVAAAAAVFAAQFPSTISPELFEAESTPAQLYSQTVRYFSLTAPTSQSNALRALSEGPSRTQIRHSVADCLASLDPPVAVCCYGNSALLLTIEAVHGDAAEKLLRKSALQYLPVLDFTQLPADANGAPPPPLDSKAAREAGFRDPSVSFGPFYSAPSNAHSVFSNWLVQRGFSPSKVHRINGNSVWIKVFLSEVPPVASQARLPFSHKFGNETVQISGSWAFCNRPGCHSAQHSEHAPHTRTGVTISGRSRSLEQYNGENWTDQTGPSAIMRRPNDPINFDIIFPWKEDLQRAAQAAAASPSGSA